MKPTNEYQSIGEFIVAEREAKAMTQEGFAKHLGISRVSLALIEKGRRKAGKKIIRALAKKTSATLDELVELAAR